MVWEKEVAIIVMVTKCVELGKRKCEQYWPEEGVCMRYGNVSVQLSHTETSQDSGYQLRTLKVHCKVRLYDATSVAVGYWPLPPPARGQRE